MCVCTACILSSDEDTLHSRITSAAVFAVWAMERSDWCTRVILFCILYGIQAVLSICICCITVLEYGLYLVVMCLQSVLCDTRYISTQWCSYKYM